VSQTLERVVSPWRLALSPPPKFTQPRPVSPTSRRPSKIRRLREQKGRLSGLSTRHRLARRDPRSEDMAGWIEWVPYAVGWGATSRALAAQSSRPRQANHRSTASSSPAAASAAHPHESASTGSEPTRRSQPSTPPPPRFELVATVSTKSQRPKGVRFPAAPPSHSGPRGRTRIRPGESRVHVWRREQRPRHLGEALALTAGEHVAVEIGPADCRPPVQTPREGSRPHPTGEPTFGCRTTATSTAVDSRARRATCPRCSRLQGLRPSCS